MTVKNTVHSHDSCTPADVKPNRSPDFAASSGAVALVTSAASIAGSQPADGDVTMRSEEEQRAEGEDKGEQHREAFDCMYIAVT